MADHLSLSGFLFLFLGWGFILALNVFCFREIFKERKEDIAEPLPEIDKMD